ncbi:MAG TPA: hypothetical protein PLN52_26295, partial [Opitutaceae bacterium]|nr:hypothetical protein [Opitutaceae bacterium]
TAAPSVVRLGTVDHCFGTSRESFGTTPKGFGSQPKGIRRDPLSPALSGGRISVMERCPDFSELDEPDTRTVPGKFLVRT